MLSGFLLVLTVAVALSTIGYFGTAWSQQRFSLLNDIVREMDDHNYVRRCQELKQRLEREAGEASPDLERIDDPMVTDLTDIYSLVVRVAFWAGYTSWYEVPVRRWHVRQLVNRCGLRMLVFISAYRDAASLACGRTVEGASEQFVHSCGLDDKRCRRVFEDLRQCATRLGLPFDDAAMRIVDDRIAAILVAAQA